MPRVFVVGAPSGAGKTTLLKRLLELVPSLRFSVSHTTRAQRAGEMDGRDYHFVSRAAFDAEIERDGFLEWADVYGNRYGTHRSELQAAAASRNDLVLDVDVQGARSVRRALEGSVLVLILPPSFEVLEARLRARGTEDERSIARRLASAREQVEGYALYDYAVVNDELEATARDLAAIVTAARLRMESPEPRVARLLGPR